MSIMQALYDSEINVEISSFWDGGWWVGLGDEKNGFDDYWQCETWADVETTLREKAIEHYPNSKFAAAFLTPGR